MRKKGLGRRILAMSVAASMVLSGTPVYAKTEAPDGVESETVSEQSSVTDNEGIDVTETEEDSSESAATEGVIEKTEETQIDTVTSTEIDEADLIIGYSAATFALGRELIQSGSCGDYVNYELYSDGELIISGEGEMKSRPWENMNSSIKSVVIENGVTSICEYAFANTSSLTSLTLPSSMESLGASFLDGNLGVTEITIPQGVTSGGHHWSSDSTAKGALKGSNVQRVVFQSGIKKIPDYVCANDAVLAEVVIPNTVTEIGGEAFFGCKNLSDVEYPDGLLKIGISAFNGVSIQKVVLPDTVTSIGEYAYANTKNLTSITLSTDLEELGAYFLDGNDGVTELTIPKKIKTGGHHWSSEWTTKGSLMGSNVQKVVFQRGVVKIPDYICGNDTALTEVILPDTVTEIGAEAFLGCENLNDIIYPDSLQKIGTSTFNGVGFRKVVLPSTVTSIGEYAYANTKNLTSITLSTDLEELGAYFLDGNDGVTELTIPKKIKTGGHHWSSEWTAKGSLMGSNVQKVVFQRGVVKIPDYICGNDTALTEVILPDTVTEIGAEAFLGCENLNDIIYPDCLQIIGTSAFNGVGFRKAVLPSTVTRIGEYAYANTKNLTSMTLPTELEELGAYFLDGNQGVTEITIPKGVQKAGHHWSSEIAAKGAFKGSNVRKVVFERGIEKIPAYICAYSTAISEVILPDTVIEIGDEAFSGCESLYEIALPDSLQKIGYAVFKESYFQKVEIPDSVTEISGSVFRDSKSLVSVKLSGAIEYISDNAFSGCSALTEITIPYGVTTINKYAFKDCSKLATVHWSNTLRIIAENAFENCKAIKEVSLPGNVISIGNSAFRNCDALESVSLPNSVSSIGSYVFYDCDVLENVKLSTIMTVIPDSTFENCYELVDIVLPRNIRKIGNNVFKGDYSFRTIYIPDLVTQIGSNVFSYPARTTIYGVAGSYAETYANENNIAFAEKTVHVGTILLSDEKIGMNVGDGRSIIADIQPVDITDSIAWTSSDSTIVSVDEYGNILAKKAGTATITITVGSKSKSCVVTVFERGYTPIEITKQPVDKTTSGENVYFEVAADGSDFTYQWYYRNSMLNEWIKAPGTGNQTNKLLIEFNSAKDKSQYYCKMTHSSGYVVESDAVTLTVIEPIKITKQPVNVTAEDGSGNAKFAVTATGKNLTYQWFFRKNASSAWTAYSTTSSAANTEIAVGTIAARNGFQYRCTITDSYGKTAYTNVATLTVTAKKSVISITKQPVSVTAEDGSGNVKFAVTATGSSLTYQWYWRKNASSAWTAYSTTASASNNEMSVGAIAARNGFQYRCTIKDSYGTIAYSNIVTLTVTEKKPVISITKQPVSVTAEDGSGSVKFAVTATGSSLTYQWYWRKNASSAWTAYNTTASASNTEISVGAIAARNGYQYRCTIKDSYGTTAYSNIVTLTVTEKKPVISITKQPVSVTAADGSGNVKFAVTATGSSLTYQWYWRKNASSAWTAYNTTASASNTEISVGAIAARNGYQYRCTIKDSYGTTAYSNIVTLTVTEKKPVISITKQPVSVTAADGSGNVKFAVTATGSSLTYQWYWRKNASSAWTAYNTTASASNTEISVGAIAARNGYQYRCTIKDSYGTIAYSNIVTLTVTQKSSISILVQPSSATKADGSGNVNFSVIATGSGLTYQWYWRKDSSSTWAVSGSTGAKTATLTIGAISARNGFQYYCEIKDAAGSVTKTNTATLTVTSSLSITKQPVNVTAADGSGNVKFTVAANGNGLTYQWYWRKNASSAWAAYGTAGASNTEISIGAIAARNGYQYYCLVKDSSGRTVSSNIASLKIVDSPTILKQPVNITAKNGGSTVKFAVDVTGVGVTYQWYWRKNASSSWAASGSTGAKTSTLSIDPITARNGFQYFCVIIDASGRIATTDTVTLTVN